MTDPAARLFAAEAEAALARERLSGTVAELQGRLDPQALVEEARGLGVAAGRTAIDGARRHPGAVAGAIASLALVLGRHRLFHLWRQRKVARPLPAQPKKD